MSFFFRKKQDNSSKAVRARHIEDVTTKLKGVVWTNPSTFVYTFILPVMPIKLSVYIPDDYPTVAPVIRVLSPCTHSWMDSNRTLSLCPEILNWALAFDNNLVALMGRIEAKFNASPPIPDNSSNGASRNSAGYNPANPAYNGSTYSSYSSQSYSLYGNTGYGQQQGGSQQQSQQPSQQQSQQTSVTSATATNTAPALTPQQPVHEVLQVEPILSSQQEAILANVGNIVIRHDEFSSMETDELEKLHDSLSLIKHHALTNPVVAPLLQLRDELLMSLEEAIKANLELKSDINSVTETTDEEQQNLRNIQTRVNDLLQRYRLCQQRFSNQYAADKLQLQADIADEETATLHSNLENKIKTQSGENENQAIQRYLREYIELRKRYHIAAARRERVLAMEENEQ